MRAIVLLSFGLATCAGGEAQIVSAGSKHEIQMRAVSFVPGELVVQVGDTVTWRNADIVRHNALRPGQFDTGELRPGERYTWVPADTGSFTYKCTIHQRMRGSLKVRPAAAPK